MLCAEVMPRVVGELVVRDRGVLQTFHVVNDGLRRCEKWMLMIFLDFRCLTIVLESLASWISKGIPWQWTTDNLKFTTDSGNIGFYFNEKVWGAMCPSSLLRRANKGAFGPLSLLLIDSIKLEYWYAYLDNLSFITVCNFGDGSSHAHLHGLSWF